MKKRVLTIFGTRPEAIKLAPVIIRLKGLPEVFETLVCITAQHREMLDQMLEVFRIQPDIDLNLIRDNQELAALTGAALHELTRVLRDVKPDLTLVQGDTTTGMAAALATFYEGIPLGHVEAGLRTGNPTNPFPEEINRRIISAVASYNFAPTRRSREALLAEGCPAQTVFLTGNTAIDALRMFLSREPPYAGTPDLAATAGTPASSREDLVPRRPHAEASSCQRSLEKRCGLRTPSDRKLILVTAHRRENFGSPLQGICSGLKSLARRNPDIEILYPVHLNPNVRHVVYSCLSGVERIRLIDPVGYPEMVRLLQDCHLVLTDSGGLQEEAPALGKPLLVMRRETERPEVIEAGVARLVDPEESSIVAAVESLLRDRALYKSMSRAVHPFGDGHAAERIVEALRTGSCAEWSG